MTVHPSHSKPPDLPDAMVRCVDGPHNNRLIKLRMLANLTGGVYKKDPALIYEPEPGNRFPCYRWVATQKILQAKPVNLVIYFDALNAELNGLGVAKNLDGKGGFYMTVSPAGQEKVLVHVRENAGFVEYITAQSSKPDREAPYKKLCAVDDCVSAVGALVRKILAGHHPTVL